MKIFGRAPVRYFAALKGLPQFLSGFYQVFFVFKSPLSIIYFYFVRQLPKSKVVQLRSGHVVYLSDDPADIVSLFLIFARQDYGIVPRGSKVLDIGANIGIFSLYAAISGAEKVYAFEPSSSSFSLLIKNIDINNFSQIVDCNHAAVVGAVTNTVLFPTSSNVKNSILTNPTNDIEYDVVKAITLTEILRSSEQIDLVKSDCEGAEYDIFINTAVDLLAKITEIRMEYHLGPVGQLRSVLTAAGFVQSRQMETESNYGDYMHLIKEKLNA